MTTETPTDQPLAPRRMLTVEQAAEALGIGRTTMFALIKSGELDSVRIGRLRRVPADAIDAYTARLQTEQAR
jgi:excisionase family DNA binding protein